MAGEAEQTDEVVVTVIDETQQEAPDTGAEQVAKTTEGTDDPIKDIGQQLEAMKRNAAAERAGRLAAEEKARTAIHEATVVKQGAGEAHYDSVTAGLDAANAEMEGLQRDLEAAADAAEWKKHGEISAKIGKLGYRIGRLEEAKADMDSRREAAPANERPAPAAPTDPVEAFVANRTPKTAEWLRAHPEFILDPLKQKKLTAAHWDAEAEGLQPDTPEYFAHAEKFLGLTKEEPVTESDPEPKPEPKAAPAARPAAKRTPAAPVAPTSNNGSIAHRNEVRLTKGEAEAATDGTHVWNYDDPTGKGRWRKGDPIGVQEFARRKRELQSRGAYERIYTDE